MFDNEWQNPQNLNFGASIPMQIENSLLDFGILLFNDDCADSFALIIDDLEVNTFDKATFYELLFGQNRVYVIGILAGRYHAFPTPLKVFFQGFH